VERSDDQGDINLFYGKIPLARCGEIGKADEVLDQRIRRAAQKIAWRDRLGSSEPEGGGGRENLDERGSCTGENLTAANTKSSER